MVCALAPVAIFAQAPGALRVTPNLETNIDRPLRYRPDDPDFELPLDPKKELRSLTVRALANDVVIGLMAAMLAW